MPGRDKGPPCAGIIAAKLGPCGDLSAGMDYAPGSISAGVETQAGRVVRGTEGNTMNALKTQLRNSKLSHPTCSAGCRVQCPWCKNVTEFLGDKPDIVECMFCGHEMRIVDNTLRPNATGERPETRSERTQ